MIEKFSIFKFQFSKSGKRGHILVILLFFMVLAVTVITASIALMILTSSSTAQFVSGNQAKAIAEAGIENALIRLLRDPDYSGENGLTIGNGSVDITVTGSTSKIIQASGKLDNQIKKIEVGAELTNNVLSVTYWKEII